MTKLLLALFIVVIVTVCISSIIANKVMDRQTEAICREIAPIRKQEWKDTEFKEFDWYQSCVDNIRYTTPLNRR